MYSSGQGPRGGVRASGGRVLVSAAVVVILCWDVSLLVWVRWVGRVVGGRPWCFLCAEGAVFMRLCRVLIYFRKGGVMVSRLSRCWGELQSAWLGCFHRFFCIFLLFRLLARLFSHMLGVFIVKLMFYACGLWATIFFNGRGGV